MISTNEALNVTITLPDRITVRQRLAYLGVLGNPPDNERFERAFLAAAEVLTGFECPAWPKSVAAAVSDDPREAMRETLRVNLDDLDGNSDLFLVILWVGAEVMQIMNRLDTLPKN